MNIKIQYEESSYSFDIPPDSTTIDYLYELVSKITHIKKNEQDLTYNNISLSSLTPDYLFKNIITPSSKEHIIKVTKNSNRSLTLKYPILKTEVELIEVDNNNKIFLEANNKIIKIKEKLNKIDDKINNELKEINKFQNSISEFINKYTKILTKLNKYAFIIDSYFNNDSDLKNLKMIFNDISSFKLLNLDDNSIIKLKIIENKTEDFNSKIFDKINKRKKFQAFIGNIYKNKLKHFTNYLEKMEFIVNKYENYNQIINDIDLFIDSKGHYYGIFNMNKDIFHNENENEDEEGFPIRKTRTVNVSKKTLRKKSNKNHDKGIFQNKKDEDELLKTSKIEHNKEKKEINCNYDTSPINHKVNDEKPKQRLTLNTKGILDKLENQLLIRPTGKHSTTCLQKCSTTRSLGKLNKGMFQPVFVKNNNKDIDFNSNTNCKNNKGINNSNANIKTENNLNDDGHINNNESSNANLVRKLNYNNKSISNTNNNVNSNLNINSSNSNMNNLKLNLVNDNNNFLPILKNKLSNYFKEGQNASNNNICNIRLKRNNLRNLKPIKLNQTNIEENDIINNLNKINMSQSPNDKELNIINSINNFNTINNAGNIVQVKPTIKKTKKLNEICMKLFDSKKLNKLNNQTENSLIINNTNINSANNIFKKSYDEHNEHNEQLNQGFKYNSRLNTSSEDLESDNEKKYAQENNNNNINSNLNIKSNIFTSGNVGNNSNLNNANNIEGKQGSCIYKNQHLANSPVKMMKHNKKKKYNKEDEFNFII